MNRMFIAGLLTAGLLGSSALSYGWAKNANGFGGPGCERPEFYHSESNEFGGPGGPGGGPGMMGGPGGGGMPAFGKGFWMHPDFPNPELRDILEKYQVKIEKIFLDAKESRLALDSKRRDLFKNLDELADKYAKDKTVSKDIVAATRDLHDVTVKIQAINKDAMEKIKLLNDQREKEFQASNDAWLVKLEKDPKEMDKYVQWLNSRPKNFRPQPGDKQHRDQ